jgi:hypothetical protein
VVVVVVVDVEVVTGKVVVVVSTVVLVVVVLVAIVVVEAMVLVVVAMVLVVIAPGVCRYIVPLILVIPITPGINSNPFTQSLIFFVKTPRE